jgi:anthranilate synthase component II
MIVLLDNYDSFTYNLVQYFSMLGYSPKVILSDQISLDDLAILRPSRLVISPGPGSPADSGISCAAIKAYAGQIPILGVCLGHQCIAEVFGGRVVPSVNPTHGKTSMIHHDYSLLFQGIANPFEAARYHSLVVDPRTIPETLMVSAKSDDGTVMALRHRQDTVLGIQFHPESILTPDGLHLLRNFMSIEGGHWHE